MATFAPHETIVRHLEAMSGRRDGQRLFDALVGRGMLKRWDAVEDFWGVEAFDDETWVLLSNSIEAASLDWHLGRINSQQSSPQEMPSQH